MVNSLVTHSELPTPLIQSITASLLSTLISHEGAASTELPLRIRSILVHIQQRYPDLLQKAFDETLQTDSEKKDALEQALLSLSMDLPGSSGQKIDSIVGSMSSESAVRAISVRELFEKLATGDVEDIVSAYSPRSLSSYEPRFFGRRRFVLLCLLEFKIPMDRYWKLSIQTPSNSCLLFSNNHPPSLISLTVLCPPQQPPDVTL